MNSALDMFYSTSVTKKYWCHICKKEFNKIFIENVEVQCTSCGNNFCEEISNNQEHVEHPIHFRPYESIDSVNRQGTGRNSSIMSMLYMPRVRPRSSSNFLDMIVNILGMNNQDEQSMESIINYIMANDTNRYGNPPASKHTLDSLEKILVSDENMKKFGVDHESSCSVCKDEFELEQNLLNLPCKHIFHDECIMPWLKERNSCPTCRHELPTDDPDYELRKKSL